MTLKRADITSSSHRCDRTAGVDEVGRGSLFGPVVAAAVILLPGAAPALTLAGVTDSKKLSAKQRESLYELILQSSVSCTVGYASVMEIDRINILQASLLAMRRAVQRLNPKPILCLVDGNQRIRDLLIDQETVVQGDSRCLEIAAASIVAKVWRDRLIERLARRYPGYDLHRNKGYGTPRHRQALIDHGVTRYHRRSFKACRDAMVTACSETDLAIDPLRFPKQLTLSHDAILPLHAD